MKRGIFIGRFQPFHLGHKKVIDMILEHMDEVIIGVGGAEASHSEKNPFTAGERVQMITNTFESESSRMYVIPIVDIERNAIWTSHVETLCPPFDVVYTNNSLVSRLFTEAGYDVRNHELIDRDKLSGTQVRSMILHDGDWQSRVPNSVVETIEEVDGVKRMKVLSQEMD